MGFEKQGSKSGGGGYVGGFLQLFDWNGKSRKKLFSNKSDLPEGSKLGKKNEGNLPTTRFRLIEEDENIGGSSIKGGSDYSCASSVMTDDDGYGSKAPGVVARLMGLDSLPTSNIVEPCSSTPFFDSRSLHDAHFNRKSPDFLNDHQIMHSANKPSKMTEVFSRNPVEPRSQKMQNRPIERFQTEMLPPRSAKSIPITHHKLLSPIKSPGFIPSKNAAHIMEAAAKIIEPGPQASTKGRMPSLGSSSVPLKVRDLKEKMESVQRPSRLPEASHRPAESNAVKYLKGHSLNKSWNGSEDTPQFRDSMDYSEENNSIGLKDKGKSVSLAIQAKVNVQRREGLSSISSRNLLRKQKEHNEFKLNQPFKIQQNTHKKSSTNSTSNVLRQNNQKQNCPPNKDKLPSKAPFPNKQDRKAVTGNASFERNKTPNKVTGNSKVGSRKTGLEATEIVKEGPSARTKNLSRKKLSIAGDFQFEKNGVDTHLIGKDEKPIQSNVGRDGHVRGEDNRKKGMDVVSFTFTSPMIKSMPGSQYSDQAMEKKGIFSVDSHGEKIPASAKSTKLSSMGLNVIGGDALSILLELKLRELTYGVESSCNNSVKAETIASSASVLQDLVSTLNAVSTTTPREHGKRSLIGLHTDKLVGRYNSDHALTDDQLLKMNHKWQGEEGICECSSSNHETGKELDCQQPSPVSVLEPSFSNESCDSLDRVDSSSTDVKISTSFPGSNQCLSVQAQEVVSLSCPEKLRSVEFETELSDSASSTNTGTAGREHLTRFNVTDYTKPNKWELEYVREILCNVELMFKDFTLGRAREIINPYLFNQLENRKTWLKSDRDEGSRQRRKVLFDCVSECLDLRCRKYVGGGCKTWGIGVAMVRRKEWLAEEVHKEISGWKSMGDWMVDELVDKDMSSQYGRWLDFEIEAFEIGVQIERGILSQLVDEVVTDIML